MSCMVTGRKVFALLLLLDITSGFASNCSLNVLLPDTVGASSKFRADCDLPGTSYQWDFGDGFSDSTTSAETEHLYSTPGAYNILVRVSYPDGLKNSIVSIQNIIYPITSNRPTHASTLLFDKIRSRLWTINNDNGSVVFIEYPSLKRSTEILVGKKPRSITQDAQGNIWVCNQESASLTILDPQSGQVLQTLSLPYGSRPFGLAMDMGRSFLYVTLEGSGKLLKIDAVKRQIMSTLDVTPGARGLAVNHDGSRLLVTRFISAKDQGEIVEIDGVTFAVSKKMKIAYDQSPDTDLGGAGVPNAINAVVITPDGREAWFTAKKDNVRRGMFNNGIPFNEENTVRTFFGKIDLRSREEVTSKRVDLDNKNLANAIVFNSNGLYAFVATLGSNSIDIYNASGYSRTGSIDPKKLNQELAPQGILVHPNDSVLFVQYLTTREIAVYDITSIGASNDFRLVALIKTIDQDSLGALAALGQQVFYNSADPRMTRSFYLSCITCHMDGRSDERVWDFTERGEGLRNTTTLLGKSGTGSGPLHWSANFDEIQDFEHDIRGPQVGYGFLSEEIFQQGTRNKTLGDKKAGLSAELDALSAFVSSLIKVPASPYRNLDGTFTPDAVAGRTIFQNPEVGCVKCHKGAAFTDSELHPSLNLTQYEPFHAVIARPGNFILHDVGTLKRGSGKRLNDTLSGLDTPPLKGIWSTAPYLHDGSAASLMDVIDFMNPQDRHGRTSQLTLGEKKNLVAYLEQLDERNSEGIDADGNGINPTVSKVNRGANVTYSIKSGWIIFLIKGSRPSGFTIKDLNGRTLYHFSKPAEWNSNSMGWVFNWSAQNNHGISVEKGIYLAQIQVGLNRQSLIFSLLNPD